MLWWLNSEPDAIVITNIYILNDNLKTASDTFQLRAEVVTAAHTRGKQQEETFSGTFWNLHQKYFEVILCVCDFSMCYLSSHSFIKKSK